MAPSKKLEASCVGKREPSLIQAQAQEAVLGSRIFWVFLDLNMACSQQMMRSRAAGIAGGDTLQACLNEACHMSSQLILWMQLIPAGGTEKPPNARHYLATLRKGLVLSSSLGACCTCRLLRPLPVSVCAMSIAVVVPGA